MAELSPAAQAVRNAAGRQYAIHGDLQDSIAAALRAVVHEIAHIPIVIGEPLRGTSARDLAVVYVAEILAIATELENYQ